MNSLWKIRPSDHTLKNYIDYLEDAFLFGHTRRFEVKGRKPRWGLVRRAKLGWTK